jgi:hypothetical protein
MRVEEFQPVYLVPEGPARLTEYGKRWFDDRYAQVDRFWHVLRDISKLAAHEATRWVDITAALEAEGVPTAITSGYSQYAMAKIIDHSDGKTSWTMPATVAITLTTVAPTSTSTGASITEASYSTFARVTIAGSGFNAATAATPSVSTNNGAITFAACTGGSSTLLGFATADSASLGAGNLIFYGTLASTVISTTATPPTIADQGASFSLTGT